MKRVLAITVLSAILFNSAMAEEPVYFADATLKRVVEDKLWVSDPTPTDMLSLTRLTAEAMGIRDLTGMEYATNLQHLNLRFNGITDLSPLSGLTSLNSLNLHRTTLADLSPLAGLTNLTALTLDTTHIEDISALASLENLKSLDLRSNRISDITPLSGLTDLKEVTLEQNQITDVSALMNLTHLSSLNLAYNPLCDEAYAVQIPQIVANNPGVEIHHDGKMYTVSLSSSMGGSIVHPGEGDFTYPYFDGLTLEARADPGYVFVAWTGSLYSTRNPELLTIKADEQICATFSRIQTEYYVDDDAPEDPKPDNPDVGDPEENGTTEHPFDSIQEAIDAVTEEAVIIVRPGIYREHINLLGNKVYLMAVDPENPQSGPCATIDGTDTGPVVSIPSGAATQCALSGFIITRGNGSIAGAIYCDGASPLISHCVIVGNRATDPNGAAAHFSNSQAVLTHCTCAGNYSGESGATLRLVDSDVTVTNSILWDNAPRDILCHGTGELSMRYCCIQQEWLDAGNIWTDPLFAAAGAWVDSVDPNTILEPQDVRATWTGGDYHVKSRAGRWDPISRTWLYDTVTSPCIDAGVPGDPVDPEPMPNGGVVNMGAYGGTREAGKSR